MDREDELPNKHLQEFLDVKLDPDPARRRLDYFDAEEDLTESKREEEFVILIHPQTGCQITTNAGSITLHDKSLHKDNPNLLKKQVTGPAKPFAAREAHQIRPRDARIPKEEEKLKTFRPEEAPVL